MSAGVHVLVVAYGDPGQLEHCVKALEGAYPVTVVDNASAEATRTVCAAAGASYLDAGTNLGFAAAVNLGLGTIALAEVDVLLLNPDATIDPASVELLRRELATVTSAACAAPAQHAPHSTTPAIVRWPFPTARGAWAEAIGLGRVRHGWDYVIASVLLVRGTALLDVGGLDEGFFLYAEEADWERRATKKGWSISYCQEAQAVHVGAATDPDSSRRRLRFHAGIERYVRKWHGRWGWHSYQAATVITALRRALVSSGDRRRASFQLACLYASGPYRTAVRTGAVPRRQYREPNLADGAEGA